jgi:PAS domain S-box-containing protein
MKKYLEPVIDRRRLVIFLIIITVIIGSGGYLYYKNQQSIIKKQVENTLASIAELKVQDINHWRGEQLANAQAVMESPFLAASLSKVRKSGTETDAGRDFLNRLSSFIRAFKYANGLVLDENGAMLFAVNRGRREVYEHEKELVKDAIVKKEVFISDLHRHDSGRIYLDVVVPIFESYGKRSKLLGVVFLHADPNQYLYPLIQSWPTPSKSAETLLVRRQGREIIYLNELRHRKNTALSYRRPIEEEKLSAEVAAQEGQGITEGIDYRGVTVLARMMLIPGTTWSMIAKIDKEEVFAPFRKNSVLIVSLTTLLIAGAWLSLGIIWLRQRAAYYQMEAKHARDLKEMNAVLRESDRRFRGTFEQAAVGICHALPDGTFTMVNQRLCEITGYDHAELKNKHFAHVTHQDDLQAELGMVEKLLNNEIENYNLDKRYIRKDGSIVWVNITVSLIRDSDQNPLYFIGVVQDINRRKLMEEEILHLNERLDMATSSARIGIWDWDIREGTMIWDDRMYELYGFNNNDDTTINYETWRSCVHKDDRDRVDFIIKSVFSGERVSEIEFRILHPDRSVRFIKASGLVMKDENDEPMRMVGTSYDITEIRQLQEKLLGAHNELERQVLERTMELAKANEALREEIRVRMKSEEALRVAGAYNRSLLEASLDALVTIDRNGKINDANHATEEITGVSRGNLIGTDFSEYFTDPVKARAVYEEVFRDGTVRDYELHIKRNSGDIVPVLYNASVYSDSSGEVLGVFAAARDITERKIYEWSLKSSEERYRIVADNTYDWEFWLSPEGDFLYSSPSCERITGYKAQEFGNDSGLLNKIIHPDDLPVFSVHREQITEDYHCHEEQEFRIIRKDGVIRWIGHVCQPVYDDDGSFIGIRGSNRDITEHWQARQEIMQSEEKFSKVFHQSPIVMTLSTLAEGRIVDANEHFLNTLEYTKEEVIGKQSKELGVWVDSECRDVLVTILKTEGRVKDYPVEIRTKTGKVIDLLWSGMVVEIGGNDYLIVSAVDVTGMKKKDVVIRESEKKYRDIFNNAIEGIYRVTPEGQLHSVNPAFTRMYGYDSPEEMMFSITDIGKQLYVDPLDRERFRKLITEKSFVENYEAEFIRKDGSRFWGSFNARAIKGDENKILYYDGTIVDVTERKNAEDDMQKLAREWQSTFDAVGNAVWLLDKNHRILRANRATKEIFGLDPEKVIGRACCELVHGTSSPIPGCPTSCLMNTMQRETMELPMGEKWLEVLADPIIDDAGNLSGIVHIVSDITERKENEETVKESEELYRSLAEKSLIGTYVLQDGIHVFVNNNAASMAECEPTDLVGTKASAIVHPEDREGVRNNATAMIKGLRTAPYEFRIITKRGNIRWILESNAPIIFNGKPSVLGSAMDITESKKAEENKLRLERQLRQAQKMEAIGTLAGGIAHDFNNILGAISGFTELSMEQIPDDNKAKKYLKQVFTSSRRAADLVSQILTFGRQVEKENRALRVTPIVKEVVKLLRATLPTTIRIEKSLKAEADVIFADATQIHQVIMNLCTNAGHAMQEKGGILGINLITEQIKQGDANHNGLNPGQYLKLSVSDEGYGIEPAIIDKIFDPFFTTKKQGEGTGLGLSVVHGIVKQLNGDIAVESRAGQGTAFHIWLPTMQENYHEDTEDVAGDAVKGQGRILFVDDEEMLLDISKDMLESLGYNVTTARNGIDALNLFKVCPYMYDLVITDQTMPEMTGMELAREIMKIRADMPVILCTGFSRTVNREQAMKAGVREFILKPIIRSRIAETIKRVLHNPVQH